MYAKCGSKIEELLRNPWKWLMDVWWRWKFLCIYIVLSANSRYFLCRQPGFLFRKGRYHTSKTKKTLVLTNKWVRFWRQIRFWDYIFVPFIRTGRETKKMENRNRGANSAVVKETFISQWFIADRSHREEIYGDRSKKLQHPTEHFTFL